MLDSQNRTIFHCYSSKSSSCCLFSARATSSEYLVSNQSIEGGFSNIARKFSKIRTKQRTLLTEYFWTSDANLRFFIPLKFKFA